MTGDDRPVGRLRTAVAESVAVRWAGTVGRALDTAVDRVREASGDSRVLAAGARVERAVRTSGLVAWLASEPDQRVVDLRGSLVGWLLGRIVAVTGKAVASSTDASVRVGLERVRTAVRAGPLRVVSVAVLALTSVSLGATLAAGAPDPETLAPHLVFLGVGLAGTRLRASWDRLAETPGIRTLVALLGPPDDG